MVLAWADPLIAHAARRRARLIRAAKQPVHQKQKTSAWPLWARCWVQDQEKGGRLRSSFIAQLSSIMEAAERSWGDNGDGRPRSLAMNTEAYARCFIKIAAGNMPGAERCLRGSNGWENGKSGWYAG
jgi:hypothetical protein